MTKNWNDLPDEMKEMVVDNMDLITRFRLKMVSKSDKRLVESMPFYSKEIKAVKVNEDRCLEQFSFSYIYIQWKDLKIIVWDRKKNVQRFIEFSTKEECAEMMKCMFRAIMSPQNIRIGHFTTNLSFDDLLAVPNFKLHVKCLTLCIGGDDNKWLDSVVSKPNVLRLQGEATQLHPLAKTVKCLHWREASSTDNEQLMELKATHFHICDSKITEEGINAFVKKLIDEDYPIDSEMKFERDSSFNWDKLVDGLNHEFIKELDADDNGRPVYAIFDKENNDYDYGIVRRGNIRIHMNVEKDIVLRWKSAARDTVKLVVVKREDEQI